MNNNKMGLRGYAIEDGTLVVNRDLTVLDTFLKDFLDVLNRYADHLVVSGFVSIATGRARGTEDIDVLIPIMGKDKFSELFTELQKNRFWCYQGDTPDEVFPYIKDKENIRFAKVDEVFPNIEAVLIDETKKAQFFEFTHPQKIRVKDFEFKIPPIEFEILYKEILLGSEKDIEDARHLRSFFSDSIKKDKFKEYELIIRGEIDAAQG